MKAIKYIQFQHHDAYVTTDGNLFLKRNLDTDKLEVRKYVSGNHTVLAKGRWLYYMLKRLLRINKKLNKDKEKKDGTS